MVKRRRLAIIPARGGSKRLPRKNVIDFFGKPMIAWTIEAAIASGLFDRIVVSTDDEATAEIARACGIDVPFLRYHANDDFSPITAATIHALEQTQGHFGEEFDTVVQLMANCPLRTAEDIRHSVEAFHSHAAEFQISCTRFGWLNPWWAFKLDAGNDAEWIVPGSTQMRSQDLPPLYCPTGAIWIAHTGALISAGTFYGPGVRYEPLSLRSAVDVDDGDDLLFARAMYLMSH